LHDLFEATAEEASILTENLIMSYKEKRIFSSVTPVTLKIRGKDQLGRLFCSIMLLSAYSRVPVAYDKATYEYLRKNQLASSNSYSTLDHTAPAEGLSDTDATSPIQASDDGSDQDDDTFKLVIRSAITKDITLIVRPTTKCGAIVKAFLKKAGVAGDYPGLFGAAGGMKKGGKDPKLCIDGDKMGNEVEISEAEVEDGDQAEIVGL
jgi:hypothetical protein